MKRALTVHVHVQVYTPHSKKSLVDLFRTDVAIHNVRAFAPYILPSVYLYMYIDWSHS